MKLQTARQLRAVVVSSPTSVKSFMLKFIEICHNLNRQQYIMEEIKVLESHKRVVEKKKFKLGRLVYVILCMLYCACYTVYLSFECYVCNYFFTQKWYRYLFLIMHTSNETIYFN